MSPLSIFGGFVATGAFVLLVRLRGHPLVEDVGMPKELAQVLMLGLCFCASWLLARLFPLRWGGLYLLGIGESRMRQLIRELLKECDPGTRLRK